MIGKLLGKFKGSEYYMELKEDAVDTASSVSQKAADVASDVSKASAKVVESVSETASAAAETVAKAAEDTAQPKAQSAPAKADAPAAPAAPAPVSQPAANQAPDPVDIIRAALATSASVTAEAVTDASQPTNFATDYLVSTKPAPRRRPGPSLAKFKGMAKEFKR
ncbi:MAG: hypothetical protein AAFU71_03365 [Cyanobacteria bacterium J06632_22]